MARLHTRYTTVTISPQSINRMLGMLEARLKPKLYELCDWYRRQVASMNYTYYSGYPHFEARMREILMSARVEDIAHVEIVHSDNRVYFRIRMFDDEPGCWLDQQTPSHGGALGWWRYFEFGATGTRNWGSQRYGFVPSRRGPDGRVGGYMADMEGKVRSWAGMTDKERLESLMANARTPRRGHPGVYRVGMFEKSWNVLKEEFKRRIRVALQEVIKSVT